MRNLTNLKWLYLRETKVKSLEPLKSLVNLQVIEINGCKNLTKQQVDDLKKALPNVSISGLRSLPTGMLWKSDIFFAESSEKGFPGYN